MNRIYALYLYDARFSLLSVYAQELSLTTALIILSKNTAKSLNSNIILVNSIKTPVQNCKLHGAIAMTWFLIYDFECQVVWCLPLITAIIGSVDKKNEHKIDEVILTDAVSVPHEKRHHHSNGVNQIWWFPVCW